MAKLQCPACAGVYDDVLPDGALYFHACPPLSAPELAAALAAGTVVLTATQAAALAAADARDEKNPPPAGAPTQHDAVLASLAIARPGARNENVRLTGAKDDKGQPVRAAIAAGAEPIVLAGELGVVTRG
jgi:hypothetical protein